MSSADSDRVERFSTDDRHCRNRAAYWRDVICSTFVSVDCLIPDAERFSGTISTHRLRTLSISRVRSGPHEVRRTPSSLDRDDARTILLSLQLRGHARLFQDGRSTMLSSGQFAAYDCSRPYALTLGMNCEQIVLALQESALRGHVGNSQGLTARAIDTSRSLGRVARAIILRLSRLEEPLVAPAERSLCDGAVGIIAASLMQAIGASLNGQQRHGRAALLLRAKQYVEDHLHDCELSVREVAGALGISVRYLQDIFNDEQLPLTSFIWQRRLERARECLVNPGCAGDSISQVALACGFKDFSHFSRRFREAFDEAPRAFRRRHSGEV